MGLLNRVIGRVPVVGGVFNDITGGTASGIGAQQAGELNAAGVGARAAYKQYYDQGQQERAKQYGIGQSQTLPLNALYQAMILGIDPRSTAAGREYTRLNPNATGTNDIFNQGIFKAFSQGGTQGMLNAMPGYSYDLRSGIDALENSAAGRGQRTSGQAKNIMDFGQQLALRHLLQNTGGYEGLQRTNAFAQDYGNNYANSAIGAGRDMAGYIYNPAAAAAGARAQADVAGLGMRSDLYKELAKVVGTKNGQNVGGGGGQ